MDKEEDLPEDELEDDEEKEEDSDRHIARSVNIHTLNTQVELTSSAEEDTLEVLVNQAQKILEKYAVHRQY